MGSMSQSKAFGESFQDALTARVTGTSFASGLPATKEGQTICAMLRTHTNADVKADLVRFSSDVREEAALLTLSKAHLLANLNRDLTAIADAALAQGKPAIAVAALDAGASADRFILSVIGHNRPGVLADEVCRNALTNGLTASGMLAAGLGFSRPDLVEKAEKMGAKLDHAMVAGVLDAAGSGSGNSAQFRKDAEKLVQVYEFDKRDITLVQQHIKTSTGDQALQAIVGRMASDTLGRPTAYKAHQHPDVKQIDRIR